MVYLDNVAQRRVFEADDTEGWVDIMTLQEWREEFKIKRKFGQVRIELGSMVR